MSEIDPALYRLFQTSLFAAAVTSAVLYGACVALAVVAIRRLHGLAHLPRRTFWIMTSIVVVVVMLHTAHNISVLSLLHSSLRMLWPPPWTVPAMFVSVALSFTIGDSIFIYRCWIIWGRSRWVCVPIIIFCAELGISYYTLIVGDTFSPQGIGSLVQPGTHAASSVAPASGLAAIVLTVSLNALLSAAAIARLLHARRELRSAAPVLHGGGAHYTKMARLLALSTLVYSSVWIPLIFFYRSSRAAPYYVTLVAFTAGMPLGIMLQVGGYTAEVKYVLPALQARGGDNEPRDLPGLQCNNAASDVVEAGECLHVQDARRLVYTTPPRCSPQTAQHDLNSSY